MTAFSSTSADSWADDLRGPVALHLRGMLLPVEGAEGVIFPPTYAKDNLRAKELPYAIDDYGNGKKVVQIDSVGSQANRMEPLFKKSPEGYAANPLAELIPQVYVRLGDGTEVSLLEAGHRLGDALVRSSDLREVAQHAFDAYLQRGDASQIADVAPTSLVFGVWDSRGENAKVARLVQSVVRGWDVSELHRSAQYNPPIDYSKFNVFSEDEKAKADGNTKNPLAQRGFVHVPAVDTPGGVIVRGGIVRDVTVNLVALRQLGAGKDMARGKALRRYILGLALVAVTEPLDGFYRSGCLLTPDPAADRTWTLVERNGNREAIDLTAEGALEYTRACARAYGVGEDRVVAFSEGNAKADLPDKAAKKK